MGSCKHMSSYAVKKRPKRRGRDEEGGKENVKTIKKEKKNCPSNMVRVYSEVFKSLFRIRLGRACCRDRLQMRPLYKRNIER